MGTWNAVISACHTGTPHDSYAEFTLKIDAAKEHLQGRRRRGGRGCPDPPTFENRGVDPPLFTMHFFALNCINIKQTMKILMLVKSILSKDEINLTAPKKQRNFVSPILVTTVMRQ